MTLKFKYSYFTVVLCLLITSVSVFSIYKEPTVLANSDSMGSFKIIMYHHITEKPERVGDYVISTKKLEEDFNYLKEKGYHTLSIKELYAIEAGEMALPPKSVMLTFDDGQESFYKYAFPLLKKYNFKAVLSVIGIYTEQFSKTEDHNIDYSHITLTELKEISESGLVEIGNHTYNLHNNNGVGRYGVAKNKGETLEQYKKAIKQDADDFNNLVTEHIGFSPKIFTYPFGKYSPETKDILKEIGYTAILTCYEKSNTPNSSEDWLLSLGRYNRPGKKETKQFFGSLGM